VANLKLLGGTDAKYLTHGSLLSLGPNAYAMFGPGVGNYPGYGLLPYSGTWTGTTSNAYVTPPPGTPATQTGTYAPLPIINGGKNGFADTSCVIGCSYAYRNQAYSQGGMHCTDNNWSCNASAQGIGPNPGAAPEYGWWIPGDFPSLYIPGTGAADPSGFYCYYNRMPSPRFMQFQNTCPERKTTKTLGSLSIAADRFDTHINMCDEAFWPSWEPGVPPWPIPGMGAYGHKVGYNVLFGDGHVAWYPDPQQFFIWFCNRDAAPMSPGIYGGRETNVPLSVQNSFDWSSPGIEVNCGDDFIGGCAQVMNGGSGPWGFGSGIFTLFDDWANQEAVPGFNLTNSGGYGWFTDASFSPPWP
jgi:prepilin-type processing-associated H-X9-DG protein